jgi:hypothetical protein
MDYEAELLAEARKAIAECPKQRSKIIDLYQMAVGEIEDGESAAHEYELFMGSINEIKQGKEQCHG